MARTKRTITRDSVFRGTGAPAVDLPAQGTTATESLTRQTAVWLADAEIDRLDNRCQEIKRGGWRNITRSAFIRALIRAEMEHDSDVSGVSGEQELVQRLLAKS